MYAVIETGGKQYRVEVGTELQVDLLDVEDGQSVTFDRVLLVGDGDATSIGRPVVAAAAVEAEVVRHARGEKLIVFKYRPKARTRVKKGHRQDHLVLRITDVKLNGRSAAEENRKAENEAVTERQRLEEAAARQAAADAELAARLASKSEAKPARGATAKSGATAKASATAKTGTTATKDDAATKDEAGTAKSDEATATPRKRARAADADDATDATDTDATAEEQADKPAPKRGREKKDG